LGYFTDRNPGFSLVKLLKKHTKSITVLTVIFALTSCDQPEGIVDPVPTLVEDGNELLLNGDTAAAYSKFEEALAHNPSYIPALKGLASIEEKLHNLTASASYYDRILSAQTDNADALEKKTRAMTRMFRVAEASEVSERFLRLYPENTSALVSRATSLFWLGETDEAKTLASTALKKDPSDVEALLLSIAMSVEQQQIDKAISYVDQAIALVPNTPKWHMLKIDILRGMESVDETMQAFQALVTAFPEERHFRRAFAAFLIEHDKHEEAENALQEMAIELATIDPAKLDLIDYYYVVANAKEKATNYLNESENAADLKVQFANRLIDQNTYDDARALLQEVLQDASDEESVIKAKTALARLELKSRKFREASELLEEILIKYPDDHDALLLRANMRMDNNDLRNALADLLTLQQNYPESLQGALALARNYELRELTGGATAQYKLAYELSDNAPAEGLLYADFLIRNRKMVEADKLVTELAVRYPENSAILLKLSDVKVGRGDWVTADAVADTIIKQSEGKGFLAGARSGEPIESSLFNTDFHTLDGTAAESASFYDDPTLLRLTNIYNGAGKREKAYDLLNQVVAKQETNIFAQIILAQMQVADGRAYDGETVADLVVKSETSNTRIYLSAISLFLEIEDFRTAKRILDAGLKHAAGQVAVRLRLAEYYFLTDNIDSAIGTYENLNAALPNSDIIANNLAGVLLEYRDTPAAYARAAALTERFSDSENIHFLDTYGWALFKNGQETEAIEVLNRASTLGTISQVHYHLATIHNYLGDETETLRHIAVARSVLSGDQKDLKDKIDKLANECCTP
jgi:predicted Zn-dependent protease